MNLEDISQPNCFKVLDVLREECDIPVWHDDAQGTGSVTLAGLINALRIVDKPIDKVRIVFYGAGASNTTIARLIMMAGADPEKIVMFDTKGGLHKGRDDMKADTAFYRKWELCEKTNPGSVNDIAEAMKGADVLIALSKPGPDTVKREWIRSMAPKAIVFACANPVPGDLPLRGQGSGRVHRGDGPRRLPEPGQQLDGLPRASSRARCWCARARSPTRWRSPPRTPSRTSPSGRGSRPDYIMPTMDETEVFAEEAADVAMTAIKNGVARITPDRDSVYNQTLHDITGSPRA